MAMFDLSLDKLREYRPDVAVPADLVDFWRRSIEKARTDELAASFIEVDNKLAVIDTYDVTYAGFRRVRPARCRPSSSTTATRAAAASRTPRPCGRRPATPTS